MHVPLDWRRPDNSHAATAYFDPGRGYGQIWPRPDPAEIAAFYDTEYYTHDADSAPPDGGGLSIPDRILIKLAWLRDQSVEAHAPWWRALLGDKAQSVLEIGCGNGVHLRSLRDLGHDVTGIEPDSKARAQAVASGLNVIDGNAEAIPDTLRGRRFDMVIFMHVLEHCLMPDIALDNALALLAPGGNLVIEVPNSDCLGHAHFGAHWLWLDMPRHLNFFTARSLRALMASRGLSITRMDYLGYVRSFRPEWRADQARIARAFGDRPAPRARYWSYLARTAFAPRAQRYDSLRIVARRAD